MGIRGFTSDTIPPPGAVRGRRFGPTAVSSAGRYACVAGRAAHWHTSVHRTAPSDKREEAARQRRAEGKRDMELLVDEKQRTLFWVRRRATLPGSLLTAASVGPFRIKTLRVHAQIVVRDRDRLL